MDGSFRLRVRVSLSAPFTLNRLPLWVYGQYVPPNQKLTVWQNHMELGDTASAITPLERPLRKDHWACEHCVTDQELQRRIRMQGVSGWCNVCGLNAPRVTLEELAEWIDAVYRELYRPGELHLPEMPRTAL